MFSYMEAGSPLTTRTGKTSKNEAVLLVSLVKNVLDEGRKKVPRLADKVRSRRM